MADNKSCEGKVIGGKRKCGKTTELIKKANREWLYIVCGSKSMAEVISNQAKEMNLDIPYPITVNELPLKGRMDRVLVDEAELILSALIGRPIAGMSSSFKFEELDSINDEEGKRYRQGALTMDVDIDVSETIKGLKAIQREAKEATRALRELEIVQQRTVVRSKANLC